MQNMVQKTGNTCILHGMNDKSCFAYNRWIAFCVGINQIAYAQWREIFWTSPGLNSDPDYHYI